jgi:hypothetical protein
MVVSKEVKDSNGKAKYQYKSKMMVSVLFKSISANIETFIFFDAFYQMRLSRIWSRNAENSSALFYLVKT